MNTQSMKVLVLSMILLMCQNILAYSPRSPTRHVVSSGGPYVFVMLLGNYEKQGDDWVQTEPPNGSVFKVTQKGKFKKLWTAEGWFGYPEELFLSSDGKTLVRIRQDFLKADGTFVDDEESGQCLYFYRKGKLIKSYTIKDLVTDLKTGLVDHGFGGCPKWVDFANERGPKIAPSEWHRIEEITEGEITSASYPSVFHLTTLEGRTYIFDLETGWILTKRPLEASDESDKADGVPSGAQEDQEVDPFATEEAEQAVPPNGP